MRSSSLTLLLAGIAVAVAGFAFVAQPRSVVETAAPTCGTGDVRFLGFSEALDKSNYGGYGVTELSGLQWSHEAGAYYAISDRSGDVRAHVFRLLIDVAEGSVKPMITGVTNLTYANGAPYDGLDLDGEGLAVTGHGDMLLASEGGGPGGVQPDQPELRRFSPYGQELAELEVPSRFLIGANNASFESMTLTPGGHRFFTAMERPLPDDGLTSDNQARLRILQYDDSGTGFRPARQFYYLTERDRQGGDMGITELLALSETELLVLERSFEPGKGNTVRVFHTSVKDATDVSGLASLTGARPLVKTLLFDLAACPDDGSVRLPPGATQANPLLDNFEAMALGPDLEDGRALLILISDDNSGTNQTTRVVAVSVSKSRLGLR